MAVTIEGDARTRVERPAPAFTARPLDRRFPRRLLDRYVRRGSDAVLGWLERADARLVQAVADAQTVAGIRGSVGEIGVHHGKLFILLYLTLHSGERAFCIDVFEAQELNPDGSGHGDEAALHRNLLAHAGSTRDITVLRTDSVRVRPPELLDAAGRVRLFSVDGGHAADIVCSDMALAFESLDADGVILLDDYFEHEWPGVSDGTHRFFSERRPDLAPFAIGVNKVYFSRPAAAALYRRALRAACPDLFLREARFMGATVDIYQDGRGRLRSRFTATPFWLAIRTTPLGRAGRAVWRALNR